MRSPLRNVLLVILIALSLTLLPACTGLEPALIGTAAQTGAGVFNKGKLKAVHYASLDDGKKAAIRTFAELGYHVIQTKTRKAGTRIQYRAKDDRNSKITITLSERSPTLLRSHIDVGFLGHAPTAQLLLQRLDANLPPPPPSLYDH